MNTESSYPGSAKSNFNGKDILCCLLLTAVCLFVFRETVGGRLLFGSDFVGFYQGMKQFLLDEVHKRHSIPLWNPYVFSGIPFWAHFESTIFYPLDILFWFMAPENAFGYTMLIHMVLASIFMYGLLRSFSISRGGSFVGAVIFTINGFIMATLYDGQMFRVQAYIWLPLVIYFVFRAFRPGNWHICAVLAGLFWGFQILSGSPQDALYTLMAVTLFSFFGNSYGNFGIKTFGRQAAIQIIFLVFGLGTAAIQIIPAIEFIKLSVRSAFDTYELVTLGSYPLEGLITSIIPDFFGRYMEGEWFVENVPWSIPLYNLYVGVLPLIMILFISFNRNPKSNFLVFAILLALGALLLALGANTPLYKLLYMVPGFDRIRAPAKIINLYVFAFGVIAANGIDEVFSLPPKSIIKRIWIVMILFLSMLVLGWLFYWDPSHILSIFSWFLLDDFIPGKMLHALKIIRDEFHIITLITSASILVILFYARGVLHRKSALTLLCAVVLFDLTYMNWGALRYDDKGYEWSRNLKAGLAKTLGKDKSIFRVGSYPNPMGPNFEMYLGYQTIAGYNPLYLHRYHNYIRTYNPALLDPGDVWFFYSPNGHTVLMDLLNVKYEISHERKTFSLRKSYLPRVFFVPGNEIVNRAKIFQRLIAPGFDPRQTILFETEDSPDIKPTPKTKPPGLPHDRAITELKSYGPDEIRTSVQAPKPGYLFFSEAYYPGWKARLDGQSVPILRGNYLFRVVQVPEGKHEVTLTFEPASVKVGIWITALTLLTIGMLMLHAFVWKRR